ncbi:MAG: hypothetical protein OQK07_09545 [Rhodospirillales bacterium]|nr:hypothetical protein [Rhodospirillales bacterium]
MSRSVSYEVQSYRDGKWMIDSVYDEKEMAMYVARDLLDSPRHKMVQVLEEAYDESSGEFISKVIFSRKREIDRTSKKPAVKKQSIERIGKTTRPPVEKGSTSFVKYMILLVVSVGGIALTLIIGMYILLEVLD